MLETVEQQTGAAPQWCVLWLHGLGADGNDFAPIVPQLLNPEWPALRFVFPHAPQRQVTINGGMRMRAWYDIRSMSIDQRADEQGVRESIAQLEELIAHEGERGIPPSRIILAGFSQGGAIVLSAALRRQQAVGGVMALSTYLPLAAQTPAEATAAGRSTPIFMAHGQVDPVVTLGLGERSRDALRAMGVPVQWHTYPMAHAVCPDEIDDIRQWLGQRFQG
ncbi:MAG: dienelactone hydrolase family protein [Xanthomonadaceae bacterium]|nr:dienelactone hydrolase family protein [Xanthomonadaceae bacterium]MDP2185860.1 dienelactone hydrolase family protein [Xanthomonadales bacterium]MDZ4117227.1 dienelactone hydrolase family protein [Xanthomonadaceae bacterium]MDZ4378841.1 dienelactone hydrolase family protein [Xanthomonadaceae bacterium]